MQSPFEHHEHLEAVGAEDARFLRVKDTSYGASWKLAGGRSAWFMLRRKIDRMLAMMARPKDPAGGRPNLARLISILDNDTSLPLDDRRQLIHIIACHASEDIFTRMEAEGGGGEDGTMLAEVRDLRRYLLLVECEMIARGVVPRPTRAPEVRPLMPPSINPDDIYLILSYFWGCDRSEAKRRAHMLMYQGKLGGDRDMFELLADCWGCDPEAARARAIQHLQDKEPQLGNILMGVSTLEDDPYTLVAKVLMTSRRDAENWVLRHVHGQEDPAPTGPGTPEDGGHHERVVPRFANPSDRLDDGLPLTELPKDWGHWYRQIPDGTFIVDRNTVDPDLWGHLPRLALELNAKEHEELTTCYRHLYRWHGGPLKWCLEPEFQQMWGREP